MDEKEGNIEKQKLLDLSSVSLTISNYNDLFSSFDPRAYSQRGLSQDMLSELQRATRETIAGKIELTFIMPRDKRNWEHEVIIKRRLKEHFKKHYMQKISEAKRLKMHGIGMAISGVILIFLASLLYSIENSGLFIKFLEILLEPAGWFTAWTGLEDIYYTGRELKKEMNFYEKLSNSQVQFLSV